MSEAKVRFNDSEADITFDPAKTDPVALVAAIHGLDRGYKATPKE